MQDPLRPKLVKIGKARSARRRLKTFRTAVPEMGMPSATDLLDYSDAERQVHARFADKRDKGEFFAVTPDEARQAWEDVAFSQAVLHRYTGRALDFGRNAGLLPMPTRIPANRIPALKWLFEQTCPSLPDMTIGMVVRQALGAMSGTERWARALRKAGIELQSCDDAAVFDKSKGGALERLFSTGEAKRTWREQLAPLAGVDAALKPVKISVWLKYSMCHPLIQAAAQA